MQSAVNVVTNVNKEPVIAVAKTPAVRRGSVRRHCKGTEKKVVSPSTPRPSTVLKKENKTVATPSTLKRRVATKKKDGRLRKEAAIALPERSECSVEENQLRSPLSTNDSQSNADSTTSDGAQTPTADGSLCVSTHTKQGFNPETGACSTTRYITIKLSTNTRHLSKGLVLFEAKGDRVSPKVTSLKMKLDDTPESNAHALVELTRVFGEQLGRRVDEHGQHLNLKDL